LRNKFETSRGTIKEAKKKYENTLNTLKDAHIIAQKEKDAKTSKTLSFLQSIGFTDIPQSVTDAIISQINNSGTIKQSTKINSGKINLAEGELGFEGVGGGDGIDDINNRINFAKLVNKMIGVRDEK